MTPVTIAQLRATPTVDLMTAARALGLRPRPPAAVSLPGHPHRRHLPRPHRRPARAPRPRSRGARPEPCRPASLTAANLAMPVAPMLRARWSCRLQPPPGSATRWSFAIQSLSVPAVASETGAEPVHDGLDAHRLRAADHVGAARRGRTRNVSVLGWFPPRGGRWRRRCGSSGSSSSIRWPGWTSTGRRHGGRWPGCCG